MSFGKEESKVTRVLVSNAAKFIEMEPFTGKRNAAFEFPQYLINAMLGWAMAVAE
ncbi:hypothetical protein SDC9_172832 [bioreactor metagenome]|uniref:Uncharacterized protein n=1 Tax=bioreactor metagenome TaxID=1076179 RepID=A0A645GNZ8_9ZZZZ